MDEEDEIEEAAEQVRELGEKLTPFDFAQLEADRLTENMVAFQSALAILKALSGMPDDVSDDAADDKPEE